eukprot:gnl/TRDRNA2_/TRDRNA2_175527_c0_seq1.p1 gnl/TRDRNA2_/TRDRNA2_175527_c0~~gnl/TRDRNA2_/TRDRNA2_175527_c0_seq1.p1  ORF type:complete len:430 (+),score=108.52 gnl/TRDRNA2_/TRDRNA2_175527_c0_seq1:114-1403(+)
MQLSVSMFVRVLFVSLSCAGLAAASHEAQALEKLSSSACPNEECDIAKMHASSGVEVSQADSLLQVAALEVQPPSSQNASLSSQASQLPQKDSSEVEESAIDKAEGSEGRRRKKKSKKPPKKKMSKKEKKAAKKAAKAAKKAAKKAKKAAKLAKKKAKKKLKKCLKKCKSKKAAKKYCKKDPTTKKKWKKGKKGKKAKKKCEKSFKKVCEGNCKNGGGGGGGGGKKKKTTTTTTTTTTTQKGRGSPGKKPTTDQDRWINVHNYWRCVHGKDLGTNPMVWDDGIAVGAQKWADRGQMNHDKCYDLQPPQGPVGENLAGGSNVHIEESAYMWHDENPDKGPGAGGHTTAMLWKSAFKLGCGIGKDSRGGTFTVCRYGGGDPLDKRKAANFGGSSAKEANVGFPDDGLRGACEKKWPCGGKGCNSNPKGGWR